MASKKTETILQELVLAAADNNVARVAQMLRDLPAERMEWAARGALRVAVLCGPRAGGRKWVELLEGFGLRMDVAAALTAETVEPGIALGETQDEVGLEMFGNPNAI